jgi:uncharacterized protein YciI
VAYFCYRLIGPRPGFPADMTAAEGAAMDLHAAYWAEQVAAGAAIAVGPVFAPDGAFGLAVLVAEDEAIAAALVAADPVLEAELGFGHRLDPMPSLLHR